MFKGLKNKFGAVCMNVALASSSLSAAAAQQAYYRSRSGGYAKNNQYLADSNLQPYSLKTIGKQTKYSETVRQRLSGLYQVSKGQKTLELVLVDANVRDKVALLKQAKPGLDVLEIKENGNVLSQLAEILARYNGLNALHIVSHAESGRLFLGGEYISKKDLENRIGTFKAINQAVKKGGDLLLYGCELAKDEEGNEFLEVIKGNTHVDVAASSDKTGNLELGADWDLEITKGMIDAHPLSQEMVLSTIKETLQTTVTVEQEIISSLDTSFTPGSSVTVYTKNGEFSMTGAFYKNDEGVPYWRIPANHSIADNISSNTVAVYLTNYALGLPSGQTNSTVYHGNNQMKVSFEMSHAEFNDLSFYYFHYDGNAGNGNHKLLYHTSLPSDSAVSGLTDTFVLNMPSYYLNQSSYYIQGQYVSFYINDNDNNSVGGYWNAIRIYEWMTIKYQTANYAPSSISLSDTTVDEGLSAGSLVGLITANDDSLGTNPSITFSLEAINDHASFTIDGDSLKTNAIFDAGVKSSYNITIKAEDDLGASSTQQVAIAVNTVISSNPIEDYANDNTNPEPTVADYTNFGVTGVTSGNLSEVNAAVDALTGSDVDTDTEVQAIVDAVVAGNVIEAYADSNANPAPTVSDYSDLGVTGVTSGNLSEVNAAVDALTGSDVDTNTEVQAIVDAVVAGNVIEAYADSNANPAPTVSDYSDLGVTGVTSGNLTEVNAAVDSLTGSDVDTDTEVQAIVDAVVAGNVIEAYADSNANPAPTVSDYSDLGVTGVTSGNLTEVNAAVDSLTSSDVDTDTEVQAIVDAVVAGNVIEAYADSNANPAPTVSDYSDLGVTGVTSGNLTEVNAAVDSLTSSDVDTDTEVQAIVDAVVAGNVIEAYADSNANPAPTVSDYSDLGVTGVTSGNLTEVNAAVDSLTSSDVDTDTEVQAIVDAVVAGNVIEAYADSNANPTPTVSDYSDLGVTGVTSGNLTEVNAAIDSLTSSDVDTDTEVQAIVDAVVAGNVIEAYADSNANPAPTVSDYSDLGVTGVTSGNLTEVNAAIDSLTSSDVDTDTEVQAIVDAVVAGNVIEAYADSNANPAPTVSDYSDLGVTGVTSGNLTEVNAAVDSLTSSDVDTDTEVQAIVDAVVAGNVIEAYADSNANPAPTVSDYSDLGVTGVTSGNFTEVNAAIDSLTSSDVDTDTEVQAIVDAVVAGNVIEAYADSNANPAPTVSDYSDLGVTGVTSGNLTEVNAAVDSLTSSDVDTDTEVQAIVDAVVAGNVIEAYADSNANPAPTASDYSDFGVTGVTSGNLTEVNAAVDSLTSSDVDTDTEVQAIVDAVVAGNVIEAYADSNANPAPTVSDYSDLGVTGVTSGNLTEVNAAVDALSSADVDDLSEVQSVVDGVLASPNNWTGTVDTDWGNASNWSKNSIPDSSSDVTIPDVTNQPVIDSIFGVNDLTIETGATLTLNSAAGLAIFGTASGAGNAIVKRNTLGNRGYSVIGSPVSSQMVSALTPGFAYAWDEVSNTYVNAKDSTLTAGQGMFIAFDGTSPSVTFTGMPNSDTVRLKLSKVGAGENSVADGFNLVANPYTAAISRTKFITTNSTTMTGSAIYLWDDGGNNLSQKRDGDFVVINNLGVTLAARGATGKKFDTLNNAIGSVQGFYILAANDGDTLTFTPDMQVLAGNADSSFFRKSKNKERATIKMSLSGQGSYNELLIAQVDDATNDVDMSYDAPKLKGNNDLSFYSLIDDQKYAIQAIPNQGSQWVKIGFEVAESGTYELGLTSLAGMEGALLIDKFEEKIYDLNETDLISIELESGSHDDRFEVLVGGFEDGVTTLDTDNGLSVVGSPFGLQVHYEYDGMVQLTIVDLQGREIFDRQLNFTNGVATVDTLLNPNKIYVLRVNGRTLKFVLN